MTLYSCAQGPPNDLFWKDCSDADFVSSSREECKDYQLNEIPGYKEADFKAYFVRDEYGYDLTSLRNVIFTNGNLDPWSAGGITTDHLAADAKRNGVYVYNVDGSAHHLDLRAPNTCDPEPIRALRYQVVGILQCWLGMRTPAECSDAAKLHGHFGLSVGSDCTDDHDKYLNDDYYKHYIGGDYLYHSADHYLYSVDNHHDTDDHRQYLPNDHYRDHSWYHSADHYLYNVDNHHETDDHRQYHPNDHYQDHFW